MQMWRLGVVSLFLRNTVEGPPPFSSKESQDWIERCSIYISAG